MVIVLVTEDEIQKKLKKVKQLLIKDVGVTKGENARVYIPKEWEGKKVVVGLLPEDKEK